MVYMILHNYNIIVTVSVMHNPIYVTATAVVATIVIT